MSNEEFEREMGFVVSRQAQFAVDIQKLRGSQAQTELLVKATGTRKVRGGKVSMRRGSPFPPKR